jgi:hypothetical protein
MLTFKQPQIPSFLQLPNIIACQEIEIPKPDVSGWLQYPNHSLYLICPIGEQGNIDHAIRMGAITTFW